VTAAQPGVDFNTLTAVDATSATNAWAVGACGNGNGVEALAEHWNGTDCTVTTVQDSIVVTDLSSVPDTVEVWAVGGMNPSAHVARYCKGPGCSTGAAAVS
jgi:hypothetical protein